MAGRFAHRLKGRPQFAGKNHRLFPGGEVAALFGLVVVDQVGIGPFGPAPRGLVLLAGEDVTATGMVTPLALKKPPLYS